MPTLASIFSGCGGLDLGFKELGFDLVYACDHDADAVDTYSRNIGSEIRLRDVRSSEFREDLTRIGTCDVVLGGFPCQGFSKAGPKNETDSRNSLYEHMRDAIAILRPRVFIAENVDGMSQNYGGAYRDRIQWELRQIGYRVETRILDAASFGVAQHRRRIFFVGTRGEIGDRFEWPQPSHAVKSRNGEFRLIPFALSFDSSDATQGSLLPARTIRDSIEDLKDISLHIPDHNVTYTWPAKYGRIFSRIGPGQKLCNVRHAATSVHTWDIPEVFGEITKDERIVLDTLSTNRRHKRYGSIPNGNPLHSVEIARLSGLRDVTVEVSSLVEKGYLKRVDDRFDLKGALFCSGIFRRPLWNEPSPTVLTNFHNPRYFLHPTEDRPFSLRECARLQGFPDSFEFTSDQVDLVSGYRLVGNAVPPIVSRRFAEAALSLLNTDQVREVV